MKKIELKGTIVSNDDKWIYDYFGIEAVCPKDIQNALKEANGEDVTIEVNSGGGDLFSGNEMYYLLSQYPGETTADIVGLAASAATIVCCGAKRVRAVPGAMYMIHNVAGEANGDYRVMDKHSEVLKTANKAIVKAFMQKTNLSEKELLTLMDKESWFSALQAKERGFIDEIIGEKQPLENLYNHAFVQILSNEVKEKIRNLVKTPVADKQDFILLENRLKLLKLKGEIRDV